MNYKKIFETLESKGFKEEIPGRSVYTYFKNPFIVVISKGKVISYRTDKNYKMNLKTNRPKIIKED